MKRNLLILLVVMSLAAGCTQPQASIEVTEAISPAPVTEMVVEPGAEPSATPQPSDTPAATAEAPGFGEAETYQDEFAGFAFDYPKGWTVVDVDDQVKQQGRGYTVTLMSWPPDTAGGGGAPAEGSKVDVSVLLWEPVELEAFVSHQREVWQANSAVQILSEEPWTLESGLAATHMQLMADEGEVFIMLSLVNGRFLLFSGEGDQALVSQIARTLRPLAPGS